jgi:hypothetical protein
MPAELDNYVAENSGKAAFPVVRSRRSLQSGALARH